MIRWILITLLAGSFLSGYYLGHQPGSPDIFAWASNWSKEAHQSGNRVATTVDRIRNGFNVTSEPSGEIVVEVGGKFYRIGATGNAQERK